MKKISKVFLILCCAVFMLGCTKKDPVEKETPISPTKGVEESDLTTEDNGKNENGTKDTVEPVVKVHMKVAALKGPTAIGMVKLMEETENGNASNQYEFTVAGAADEITAGLLKGEFDVAAVPCNLASVLYNRTEGKIKMAAINTLGVLYIIQTGDSIKTVEDLKGKTIYSTGLGTTPQYTLNYLLSSYGIDPDKDVTIEYKTEATEVAAIISETEDGIAMLPQPFVTTVLMNNDKASIALDVTKEWENISKDGSTVVTGVLVVREEFLENNKEAFDVFLEEYQQSAEYANENVDNTAELLEKQDIFKAAVAKKAIPFCNITMITGNEMELKANGYLSTLFQQNPQSVGGNLPEENFYYKK